MWTSVANTLFSRTSRCIFAVACDLFTRSIISDIIDSVSSSDKFLIRYRYASHDHAMTACLIMRNLRKMRPFHTFDKAHLSILIVRLQVVPEEEQIDTRVSSKSNIDTRAWKTGCRKIASCLLSDNRLSIHLCLIENLSLENTLSMTMMSLIMFAVAVFSPCMVGGLRALLPPAAARVL